MTDDIKVLVQRLRLWSADLDLQLEAADLIEQLARDAERWRYLRSLIGEADDGYFIPHFIEWHCDPKIVSVDAAIDAAKEEK